MKMKFKTINIPFMKSKITLFGLILLSVFSLEAKHFRIMTLTDTNGIRNLEFMDQGKIQKITLTKNYVTNRYTVPYSNVIHFYEEYPPLGTKVMPKPTLSINFPKNNSNTIVLLERSEDLKTPLKYDLIEDDPKKFPESTVIIYNKMDKPVLSKLGDMKIKIAPNQRKSVKLENKSDKTAPFNEKVVFATPKDGSIDFFYSTYWYVPNTQKLFCVITEDVQSGTHELSKISVD